MKLRLEKQQRETIGGRLRTLRLYNKLEQTELAAMAGVSQAIISQYEKGMTELSLSFIKFLTDKFSISGDWLLFGSEDIPFEKARQEVHVLFSGSLAQSEESKKDTFYGIPLVNAQMAARPGRVQREEVTDWEIVRIPNVAGRSNLVAIDVETGWVKNINPPFQEGSRIIVDRDDKEVRPDAYYAVNTAASRSGGLSRVNAIRRLSLGGSRLWFVVDRPESEFEFLDIRSRDRLGEIIIGRIIWVWQKLD